MSGSRWGEGGQGNEGSRRRHRYDDRLTAIGQATVSTNTTIAAEEGGTRTISAPYATPAGTRDEGPGRHTAEPLSRERGAT